MINIKINNKALEVEENITILEACKQININIPTLCYLKDVNNSASCRICVVEVKGKANLVTSCSTKVEKDMEIFTNTDKVINARKTNLELILSQHNRDCENCLKDSKCKLQDLFEEYKTEEKYIKKDFKIKIDESPFLVRDESKCILCNRCVEVCENIQSIAVIGKNKRGINTNVGCAFDKKIKDVPCIACGQCILVCPTGALSEKDDTGEVFKALNNKDLYVIAITAPSVRVTLGEEFEYNYGTNVKYKMVSALKELGFKKVFDVNFGADLTIMEEVEEFIYRMENNKNLPLITSCSIGWTNYLKYYNPKMIKHLSSCKSPQLMLGAIIKSYYAKKYKINPKKMFVVSIMPCIAKKIENKMVNKTKKDVDAVITTRELARMIKKQNIEFKKLKDEDFDNPIGKGASTIFGDSGGVTESVLRTYIEKTTNKTLDKLEFKNVRGLKGLKEAVYNIEGKEIRVGVVSGISNAKDILEKIENKTEKYHFIEIMGCPGGCINGGGQPFIDFDKYDKEEVLKLRAEALYKDDLSLEVRKAHKNKDIISIYKNFLKKPGSKKSKSLLHTTHKKLKKYK